MIETKVEGDVASISGTADWLRGTLRTNTDAAADRQQEARRCAGLGWEGETAEAYQGFTRPVLKATDDHVPRIGRAAANLDRLATRLGRHQERMAGFRRQAREGGLTVDGTIIQAPPAVPAQSFEQGSPEEAAYERATAKVELYNRIAGDVSTERESYATWVETTMQAALDDASEREPLHQVIAELEGLPNFLAGTGIGLTGLALKKAADEIRDRRNEFRRRGRRSGSPRVRGQHLTREGRARDAAMTKWMRRFETLGRFAGPVGIGVDVLFGIHEGSESGDWTRAALTTGASIATGAAVTAYLVTAPVSVPATAVVLAAGAAAAGVSWGVGQVYDHWDDITGWTGDRWDDATDLASDAWDGTKDLAGDAWEAVTPW